MSYMSLDQMGKSLESYLEINPNDASHLLKIIADFFKNYEERISKQNQSFHQKSLYDAACYISNAKTPKSYENVGLIHRMGIAASLLNDGKYLKCQATDKFFSTLFFDVNQQLKEQPDFLEWFAESRGQLGKNLLEWYFNELK